MGDRYRFVGLVSINVLFQFANPNIAVADGVIVVLQSERELLRPGGVSDGQHKPAPHP